MFRSVSQTATPSTSNSIFPPRTGGLSPMRLSGGGQVVFSFRLLGKIARIRSDDLPGTMIEQNPHGPTNCRHDDKLDQVVVAVPTSWSCTADGIYYGFGRYRVASQEF